MKASPSYKVKPSKKDYPFSSARQAMRQHRRAQGGPGITEGKDPQPRDLPTAEVDNG
jgi:hypothetical protein